MEDLSTPEKQLSSPRHGRSRKVTGAALLTLVLVVAVFWLYVEVGRVDLPFEVPVTTLDQRVRGHSSDISSIASELSIVGALARNADNYAHSHGYSDVRLKTDIAPIGDPLEKALEIRGVTFRWEEESGLELPPGTQVGVIAQELEQIFPELVHESPAGFKVVDYPMLTPILLEAIREQQAYISELEGQIKTLDGRVTALEQSSESD
ncbi:MAG: tail fiber domain-containing protein [Anaerolineae bacterium]